MSSSNPRPARARTAVESLITTLAIGAALVMLNVLSCGSHRKIDLTETGIYSLSGASKRMVRALPEKLTIKAYFGNVPAEYADRQAYVENLLSEYADAAGGRIDYARFDVDASERKEAQERQKLLKDDGIQKLYLISFTDEGNKQVPAYFHVQLSYLDKTELWVLDSGRGFNLEGLEYEFSSRIRRLSAGKRKVGITKGFGEPESVQALSQAGIDVGGGIRLGLADLYEVVPVDWKGQPASLREVDVLIVNGPTEPVSEAAKYLLDQHVMSGKPVIMLMRGMKWQSAADQMQMMANPGMESPFMGMPVAHGLDDLLATWGFEVGKNVIIDGKNSVMGVIPVGNPPLMSNAFFPKAQVLNPGPSGILLNIPGMVMPWSSTVKLVGPLAAEGGDFKVQALMTTGASAFAKGEMIMITRQMELRADGAAKGPFLLGVAAEGEWPSFYAGKPRPAGVDAPAMPADLDGDGIPDAPLDTPTPAGETIAKAPPGTRLMVLGGSAFAEDQTFGVMRMVGDPLYLNGFLAAHAMVDWAAQDSDLLQVRNKQVLRPIETLESGDRLLIKYGNVAGVPLLFVLVGIIYWRVRESRRRRLAL